MEKEGLIGRYDVNTGQFTDGILTRITRDILKNKKKMFWIVFDSEIEPEWIESLNSVLDENKLLTLPTGERIQYESNVRFIFECNSLEFASPATLSRVGLINMNTVKKVFHKDHVDIIFEKKKLDFSSKKLKKKSTNFENSLFLA